MRQGFTLIELAIVILVVAIVAVVTVPKFINLTGETNAKKESYSVGAIRSGINAKHLDNVSRGIMPAYPKFLDSASTGPASVSNPLFGVVLQPEIIDGWEKLSSTSYKGPAENTYEYNSGNGSFDMAGDGGGSGGGGGGGVPDAINLTGSEIIRLPAGAAYNFSSRNLGDSGQLIFEGEGITTINVSGTFNITNGGLLTTDSNISSTIELYAPNSDVNVNSTLSSFELPQIRSSASVHVATAGVLIANNINSSGDIVLRAGGGMILRGSISSG